MRILAVPCGSLALLLAYSVTIHAQDRLRILNIAGGDSVVVMYDAHTGPARGACTQDKIRRSTGEFKLGNLLASGICSSELVILAEGNAMKLEPRVETWTNNPGDVHTVRLEELTEVPVSVWVADGAGRSGPERDTKRAQTVYSMNKVGIRFKFSIEDVSADADAVRIINAGLVAENNDLECRHLKDIQNSRWYTQKTLNVYYVSLQSTGRNCALLKKPPEKNPPECREDDQDGDGNITFIGTTAHRGVLAHELGHAFGLRPGTKGCGGHTNDMRGFTDNNIMWVSDNADMNHFTLGQVFRMNVHSGSMLVRNGQRPDLGRSCATSKKSRICPSLATDWRR